jgi:hypothetical protein
MANELPHSLLGTMRVHPAARDRFGDFLDAAAGQGRSTLLTEGGAWIWETLKTNGRLHNWDICALIPHVAGYVREATDYGMIGAGWRRLRRLNLNSFGRLCIEGLRNVGGLLRRDFPTLLTLLLEMEMGSFRRVDPPVVFLHAQITDLLLAMDHGTALQRAIERIRRGFRALPGLATNNLGTLLPRLRSWGLEVPYVLTPVHPRGYGMRPSRQMCEENLRGFSGRVVATVETSLEPSIAAYWRDQNVAGTVYDVPEPDPGQWKLWQAWQRPQNGRPGADQPAGHALVEQGYFT